MKKIATLLAALMVMTAAFAGCGSADTGSSSAAGTSSTTSETSVAQDSSVASETSEEASTTETGDYGEFTTIEEGKLIMSTNAQFPPYEMVADGEGFNGTGFEGIDVEIASAIAEKLGLELQIDDMEFTSALLAVQNNTADVMLAGGTEGTVCEVGIGGFDSMHALSRRNDDPAHASRPFDVDRDGFVMGEGCGLLVLEDYDHAVARGAKIYCELAGYGLSGDAYHITTPATDGPVRSMKMALNHAGLKPEDIDYLNAHGTSTSVGDINESRAVRELFGEHTDKLVVSSTKGATGHLLGGAGGIESVFTVLAIRDQVAPPTINIVNQDPECCINVCKDKPQQMEIRAAVKNNFGFGGTNATLVFKRV